MLYKMTPGMRGSFTVSKLVGQGMRTLGTIQKSGAFKPRPGVSPLDCSVIRDLSAHHDGPMVCDAVRDLPKTALAMLQAEYHIIPPA